MQFDNCNYHGSYIMDFHILYKSMITIPDSGTHITMHGHKFNGFVCTIYNMSGRVVSDIQTRAEGESLYIRYNTDTNVVNGLKNNSSYEFIGEVILKINVV